MKVNKAPVTNGTAKLSFIGNGRLSINMAKAAPDAALNGVTKNAAAKKAKAKPINELCNVFPLLKKSLCSLAGRTGLKNQMGSSPATLSAY